MSNMNEAKHNLKVRRCWHLIMSNRKYKRILLIKVPMTIYVFFFVQVFNQNENFKCNISFPDRIDSHWCLLYSRKRKWAAISLIIVARIEVIIFKRKMIVDQFKDKPMMNEIISYVIKQKILFVLLTILNRTSFSSKKLRGWYMYIYRCTTKISLIYFHIVD
jgi:hypothetical protein